ncbi:ABC-2 type transporter-domain-containing protein [Rhodofomes roseus]|uniref:ABC-2 type transporter-domain-containing protein n=1 Tax=Rhodofomes roseus TaxID=34475 RepID=A0ABQ8KIX0_9APHY|nr:ABC-2 type transporter-domain-containing protein [Rhodofomes roseus]KAH9837328.1 ABC-2 type transporter-domain-containing protein [Rhodofomes roseus]
MTDTPGDDRTLYGSLRTGHHVDIVQAEAEFNELARALSKRSGSNSQSDNEKGEKEHRDVEKGADVSGEETFDLRAYLTSSNDASQAAGIQHKHVGVTWEQLQVDVFGGFGHKIQIPTFGEEIVKFWLTPYFILKPLVAKLLPASHKQVPTTTIIHPQSGLLKPGEMCLVLGTPGAGCTTFLKTIANERREYHGVYGDVRYAGIDAHEMAKSYKGEVVYNMEDDIHISTLTVSQTLSFALSLKTPGPKGRLPGISRKEFQNTVLNTLLRMLNISHTANTLVGDEFVRGVSGGERKRVSIAEMMATRAHVLCFDNSTRGLDASTALDFVKSLRVMTDVLGQTVFVTLYQAGESIYELFDKVLVLDKGRQVYFGPPSQARAYFEGLGFKPLPRQSTPDYLTGCTDPNERQFALGHSEADVPTSPEQLEQAFLQSPFAQGVQDSLAKYKLVMEQDKAEQDAFRAAVAAEKKRGVSKKSPYTQGFLNQVRALFLRQFQMRLQDRFQIYTSFTLHTVLALVIGGAYFNLEPDAAGAFTRGGVLFSSLLTAALDTFGEMPVQMLGRPIIKKQTGYSLYRPAAIAIANTLADMPFSALRVFIYNVIIYFMANLKRSAGGFFTFHLFTYLTFLTMQGFFRTFGFMCTNFDSAFRLATFFLPNMIMYAGYMIPVSQMKRWLFWIYYINPISYGWGGNMENEFMRIDLECDGSYITPRNPPGINKYPDGVGPNQICTLYGSNPGESVVSGASYLDDGYMLNTADLWRRNFLVLVGFFLLFQLTQVLLVEFYPVYFGSAGVTIYSESAETKERNKALQERKTQREKRRKEIGHEKQDAENSEESDQKLEFESKTFTWENINYHVPVAGGSRRLLHDVFGFCKPGTMTALMGSSGAGKTTCLDVLAQRKNIGIVSGELLMDGRPLASDFARKTAYAEQMDVHEGTATVREAMRFSAYLRQPYHIPKEEKDAYVEEMIEVLELQDLADAVVFSLGVEARKRLTIGVELASKPSLLFLDEPTSGLDGQSAWNLVRFLRKLADSGQAILCTIHQPSSMLIQTFDKLLLLERGGETVYFGDIGQDSAILRGYFAKHGAVCPSNVNPAEFMLDAIGAGLAPRIGDRDWKDVWQDSEECAEMRQEIGRIKQETAAKPLAENDKPAMYATPFWYQLRVVVSRNNTMLWRSPDYVWSRLFVHAFISLFVSLPFLQLGNDVRDLQYRVFGIFWVTILPAVVMGQLEPMWIINRRIFIREASSRIYSPYVFAIGQLVGEMPYSVLCAVVYWVLMVYPMGFGNGAAGVGGTFFQLLPVLFTELFGVTLGQFIGAISPSMQIAPLFNPFTVVVLGIFCGVQIPYPTMESFWRTWLYQLDPYTRLLSSMLSVELHGLQIECAAAEFTVFSPPAGQTCQAWAGEFVDYYGGYLNNPNATSACQYCEYSVGDQFFTPLNILYSNRWRDVFILLAYSVFNIIATIIASRFLRYAKR